ncbi:adenylate/guanylate cyclase domain-containing protein [Colwellia asteriadis]
MKLNKNQKHTFIIGFILLITYFTALHFKLLASANFSMFDWQSAKISPHLPVDNDIVVIAIDDYSLEKISPVAGRWPWPRTIHAQLVEGLIQQQTFDSRSQSEQQPALIAFDILFAEADIYRPDADTYFNEILSTTDKVFFATLALRTQSGKGQLISTLPTALGLQATPSAVIDARARFMLPQAINKEYWQLGSINFSASTDGVGRYYDVNKNIDGWQMLSLPAKLIQSLSMPLPNVDKVLLQWQGQREQPYKTLSYVDVYQAIMDGDKQLLSQLSNKIVLVGATASGLFDARATPINPHLPGVYMLATAIDNLKNKQYLAPAPMAVNYILMTLLLAFITVSFIGGNKYSHRLIRAGVITLALSLTLTVSSYYLLFQQYALFVGGPIAWLLISFVVFSFYYGYLEYRNRQQALAMFGRFLHPEMVTTLLAEGALSPEKLNQKKELTVLFSDIRSFTQIAEKNDTQQVVELLNNYFNQQVKVIFQHRGTLDKFIGDCIMAFWGAPVNNENHAVAAIDAALEMEQRVLAFKESLPEHLQHFDIGIGIHTGECLVGMIGSDLRLDYTVIGDTVNLASRIEGLTKNNARILVSEQTKIAGEHTFDFIYHGEHQVKGRDAVVKLYQPQYKT